MQILKSSLLFTLLVTFLGLHAQIDEKEMSTNFQKIYSHALEHQESYDWLTELCTQVGPRFAGSTGDKKGVEWAIQKMKNLGFDSVYTQEVMVPQWIRGREKLTLKTQTGASISLDVMALGGSVSTGEKGIQAEIIEVANFEELELLGSAVKGKIVFFNYKMRTDFISTGYAYGDAVKYRYRGAVEASRHGAVASIIRSITHRKDREPHTGVMTYEGAEIKIPHGAISYLDSDDLSALLKKGKVSAELTLVSQDQGMVTSHNVIGEIFGTKRADEIMILAGHLDSWDPGQGAHDDGAGVVHALAGAYYLKKLKLTTERTLRVVLYANEEFGLSGAKVYPEFARKDSRKMVFAIESDGGGFVPRGFSWDAEEADIERLRQYRNLFLPYGIFDFSKGWSGADIGTLRNGEILLAGLRVENHRYFDLHHTRRDVIEEVHPRELEMGSAAMGAIILFLDQWLNLKP